MPSSHNKKAKTINLNLTEEEYQKVKSLAEIRNLNPTAYTRLVALGNRIKPTVVEYPQEQTTLEDYEEDSKIDELEKKIEKYEEMIEQNQKNNDMLNRLLSHIDSVGFIDFNSYKSDKALINQIKQVKTQKD